MDNNRVSVTALVCGYTRAYHAVEDSPKIFDDFMASRLYTDGEMAFFGSRVASLLAVYEPESADSGISEADALRRVMQVYNSSTILARARFTEDCLDEAMARGVDQYVILGAGMDTFALRRTDLADRVQVFEVDHPATQADKRERLLRITPELPGNLHLVAVDFEKGELSSALLQAGFDRNKPAFFSWLGVTYYLEMEAIHQTLTTLSNLCVPGSGLVFDYDEPAAFQPGQSNRREKATRTITRHTGEPMKTGFDPVGLEILLSDHGFRTMQNLAPVDIEKRFFANRSDLYHAFEYVHFMQVEKI